jgi:hypothetical protein
LLVPLARPFTGTFFWILSLVKLLLTALGIVAFAFFLLGEQRGRGSGSKERERRKERERERDPLKTLTISLF